MAVLALGLLSVPLFEGCAKRPVSPRILSETVVIHDKKSAERPGSRQPDAASNARRTRGSRQVRDGAKARVADGTRPVGTSGNRQLVSPVDSPRAGDVTSPSAPPLSAPDTPVTDASGIHGSSRFGWRPSFVWLLAAAAAGVVALALVRHRSRVAG